MDINSAHITLARVSHVDTEECEGGQEMQPPSGPLTASDNTTLFLNHLQLQGTEQILVPGRSPMNICFYLF